MIASKVGQMPIKITKSVIDKLEPKEKDYFLWDETLKGFGIKITPKGVKVYIAQYRTAGGRRGTVKRVTIGKHGSPWTPDAARDEAKQILALVVQGEDPAENKRIQRTMLTVSELCDEYLQEGTSSKKESTLVSDRGRIERHIKPLIGKLPVNSITQQDIKRLMNDIAQGKTATNIKTGLRGRAIVTGGKGTATRTVGLLGGIFSYAVELGLIDGNPVHGIKRFKDKKNERFLSSEELALVGQALDKAAEDNKNTHAIAIIRLLIFTGARRGEIEGLKWKEVDIPGHRLNLEDSKTGQKSISLNEVAMAILEEQRKTKRVKSSYVFPSERGEGHYVGTARFWSKLRETIELDDVRIHDLRHTFASIGVSSGTPLMIVGKLLGHTDHSTTQRYAHLGENPVNIAVEQIGAEIEKAMRLKKG